MKLLGVLLACVLFLGLAPAAVADPPPPPITKQLAKKLKCRHAKNSWDISGAGESRGVVCRVDNATGVQKVEVRVYVNQRKAIRFWRDWLTPWAESEAPGCFVKKRKVLIIPTGGGFTEEDADTYSAKWCQYIVGRVGGRVVYGYPYGS